MAKCRCPIPLDLIYGDDGSVLACPLCKRQWDAVPVSKGSWPGDGSDLYFHREAGYLWIPDE